jgi:hypothetical protein
MLILRHRNIRHQKLVPNDNEFELIDDENDGNDRDYESLIITSPSIDLPLASTENPYDKVKAIGQEVTKKVRSK